MGLAGHNVELAIVSIIIIKSVGQASRHVALLHDKVTEGLNGVQTFPETGTKRTG